MLHGQLLGDVYRPQHMRLPQYVCSVHSKVSVLDDDGRSSACWWPADAGALLPTSTARSCLHALGPGARKSYIQA